MANIIPSTAKVIRSLQQDTVDLYGGLGVKVHFFVSFVSTFLSNF
jgi:hypothetical protein